MDKKLQKCPKNGVFPHLPPPRFFFKNRALSLLYPYGALTSCKKFKKILRAVSEIFKDGPRKDQRTNERTDMGDYIGPSLVNPGSKMKKLTRQLHKHKTLSGYFVKTIWLVGSILEKFSRKNYLLTIHPLERI